VFNGLKSDFYGVTEPWENTLTILDSKIAARPHPISLPAPGNTDASEFANGWNTFYLTCTAASPNLTVGTLYFTLEYDLIPVTGSLLASTAEGQTSLTNEHLEAFHSLVSGIPTTPKEQENIAQGGGSIPAGRSILGKVNDVLTNMPVIGGPLKVIEKGWALIKGLFGKKKTQ